MYSTASMSLPQLTHTSCCVAVAVKNGKTPTAMALRETKMCKRWNGKMNGSFVADNRRTYYSAFSVHSISSQWMKLESSLLTWIFIYLLNFIALCLRKERRRKKWRERAVHCMWMIRLTIELIVCATYVGKLRCRPHSFHTNTESPECVSVGRDTFSNDRMTIEHNWIISFQPTTSFYSLEYSSVRSLSAMSVGLTHWLAVCLRLSTSLLASSTTTTTPSWHHSWLLFSDQFQVSNALNWMLRKAFTSSDLNSFEASPTVYQVLSLSLLFALSFLLRPICRVERFAGRTLCACVDESNSAERNWKT